MEKIRYQPLFENAGYRTNLDVWVSHGLARKNILDRIDLFPKRMVASGSLIVKPKRSRSKGNKPAQTVFKAVLTSKKVFCLLGGIGKESSTMSGSPATNLLIRICTCQQSECLKEASCVSSDQRQTTYIDR